MVKRLMISPHLKLRKRAYGVIACHTTLEKIVFLSPSYAVVLSLFNGKEDIDAISRQVAAIFGISLTHARKKVESFVSKFSFLFAEVNEQYYEQIKLTPEQFVYKADEDRLRRILRFEEHLDVPIGMIYVVTNFCKMRCKYCYAGATYASVSDATELQMPIDILKKIIKESGEIGMLTWVLSGGEPFLRRDLTDIIQLLIRNDIGIVISTKAYLDESYAKKLKDVGLNFIQVSLDSPTKESEDFLTGVKGSYEKIVLSIQNLVKHGIEVRVNTVVTSYNIKQMRDHIDFLVNLGVSDLDFALYGRSLGRHKDALMPSIDDFRRFKRVLETQQHRNDIKLSNIKGVMKSLELSTGSVGLLPEELPICGACRIGMVMMPDGRATICERLAKEEKFIVGDLKRQSIMEIWNSEKVLKYFHLSRKMFEEPCGSCKHFEMCSKKGICFLRSSVVYGSFYRGNPFCSNVVKAREFVRIY